MTQAKRRHVLLIHQDNVLAIALDEGNVRLDQPRLAQIVALSGARIERADKVNRRLHILYRSSTAARQLAHVFLLQQYQAVGDDVCSNLEEVAGTTIAPC